MKNYKEYVKCCGRCKYHFRDRELSESFCSFGVDLSYLHYESEILVKLSRKNKWVSRYGFCDDYEVQGGTATEYYHLIRF